MIFRFFAFASLALLLCTSHPTQAQIQGFSIQVDSAQVKEGTTACIPVRCTGFNDITSFQFSLYWEDNVIDYLNTQDYALNDWLPSDFNETAAHYLLVGWSSITGLPRSLPDGTVLFKACYQVVGAVGSSTPLVPGGGGFPPGSGSAEAYNVNNVNVWDPNSLSSGLIEVNLPAGVGESAAADLHDIQISPNPTHSAATLYFQSDNSGKAQLQVLRADGSEVYSREIELNAGRQSVEISREGLPANGLYQLNLRSAASSITRTVIFQ